MDKITRLLDITEHPEKYDDETLQEMFKDEQLSQYYQIMTLASSAYHTRRAERHEPDNADEAWAEFQSRRPSPSRPFQWWRTAAIIIGVLISGFAIAALWPFLHTAPQTESHEIQPQTPTEQTETTTAPESPSVPIVQSVPTTVVFKNSTLEEIIKEAAAYYGCDYTFENKEAGQLRLHVKWQQQAPIDSFVNRLNRFETFNIILHENTIIIQ